MRNQVPVVVPHHDVFVTETGGLHSGTEVKLQEVPLLLGRVDAGLPALNRHGLVLNGHPPNGQSLCFIGLNELYEVLRPRAVKLRQQGTPVQHVLVRLHESRWTPRAGIEHQVLADHLRRPLDHGDALDGVRGYGEGRQSRIPLFDVGMAPQPKVTGMDAGTDDVVSDALLPEVGLQQRFLLGGTHLGEHFGSRIGDRAAHPEVGLELLLRIDENGHLRLQRLVGRFECTLSLIGQPFVRVFRRGKNTHSTQWR